MIEFANVNDIDSIIQLWKTCFGDNDKYIKNFIVNRMTSENCLVYRKNQDIISMMFLLSGEIKIAHSYFKSLYIYAACTVPEQRGKGIMAQIIKAAEKIARNNDIDYICLAPATESLFQYYSKFGFIACFKKKILSISRKQLNLIAAENAEEFYADLLNITKLRNDVFNNEDYFVWDKDAVNYSISENEITGGSSVNLKHDGHLAGYAIYCDNNEYVLIKELCVKKEQLDLIFKLIFLKTNADHLIFNLPVNFPLTSDDFRIIYNGMIKPVSAKGEDHISEIHNAYLGLTLE